MVDLAGRRVITDQRQRGLKIQPCGKDPAHHDVIDGLSNAIVIISEILDQFRRDGGGIGCRRPAAAIRGSPGRDYMEHVRRQYYGGRRACYWAHPVAPGSIASYAGRATRV